MGKSILVVDDERDIAEIIQFNLESHGYLVQLAYDGESGLEKALAQPPHLLILDVGMPGVDGYEVCRRLKSKPETRRIPVIFLTGRDTETDAVAGLSLGAEDYIRKPFGSGELVARVDAVFRRLPPPVEPDAAPPGSLSLGPIVLNPSVEDATVQGKRIRLTAIEFQLFRHLASRPNENFSRAQLRQAIGTRRTEDYIDEVVDSIRRKLRRYGKHIVSVRGLGYRAEP